MSFVKKAAAGALLGGSALFTAGLGVADAQPVEAPDGLVNLSVGDVTILEGVSADTVGTTAGALCAKTPTDVGALAHKVDTDGANETVCSGLPGGPLVITQNVSSSSDAQQAPAGSDNDSADTPHSTGGTGSTGSSEGSHAAGTSSHTEATAPGQAG